MGEVPPTTEIAASLGILGTLLAAAHLTFTVRGFYDAVQDNENLQFHYEYLRESLPASFRGDVGTFVVLARSAQAVGKVARAIDETFKNSPAETKSETERAFKLSSLAYLGNVKMFLLVLTSR